VKTLGIIPARFASTRFPGKPLADILGKPMIQRVYEQCKKCKSLNHVVVATDDKRIVAAVKKFGGDVILTSSKHQSGTDRCAEVAKKIGKSFDCIINIQGDEPLIQPQQITTLIKLFLKKTVRIGTLVKKISSLSQLQNPSVAKVVMNKNNEALYFSRSPIPFVRNHELSQWLKYVTFYKHIGIYGYRPEVLKEIVRLPVSKLEKAEQLEQLRWLENGYTISVAETKYESESVDTPGDIELIKEKLKII
jgi:3-deoxy-manno-octulosonate cytidylyltransferase (CMP-KDO synthetase)